MSNTRRAQTKVSLEADGVVYLLHFHERLGTERHYAQHYFGFTDDLDSRVEKHRAGQGARITEVLKERGIGFDVVAVWPGNRQIENALKLHSATRTCPKCTPNPRIPRIIRKAIEAEQQQAQGTQQRVAESREPSAYQRGADVQKRAAGVMTSEQRAEHTALRRGVYGWTAPQLRGRIQRLTAAEISGQPDPWAVPMQQARPAAQQREIEPEAG